MNRTLKTVCLLASGLVLLSFVVVVVNQTAQVVDLASHLHPAAGKATLIGLLGLYGVLGGVPVVLYFRLPRSLKPPASEEDRGFEEHIRELAKRLSANKAVAERPVAAERGAVNKALAGLDRQAEVIVRETARLIFLSTAVSQFGKLDGLIVLGAQSRMIWRLAHLYSQRPTPSDLVRLYGQVAGTAFAAGALEDADLNEVVQPVLSSTLGSMAGSIPGLQTATAILVNSVVTGTANAYLTLRVGLIARRYCGAVVIEPASALRRSASAEAARMLSEIVSEGTGKLVKAVGGAAWNLGTQAAGVVGGKVKGTISGVAVKATDTREFLSGIFRRAKTGPEAAG